MSGRTPCWPAVICAGSVRGAGIHRVVGDDEPAAGSGDRVPVRGAGPIVVSSRRRRRTGGGRPAAGAAAAAAETDSRMTTAPAPLLTTLPRRRPKRRAPAERTTVVPLEGDLEARPRELEAELVARLCRDTTLVLDLRGATFLGAGAARLLLDLRSQAAAGVRLVLWRPEGQPFRTLRSVRFDRVFELRPASWRPLRSRDWTAGGATT